MIMHVSLNTLAKYMGVFMTGINRPKRLSLSVCDLDFVVLVCSVVFFGISRIDETSTKNHAHTDFVVPEPFWLLQVSFNFLHPLPASGLKHKLHEHKCSSTCVGLCGAAQRQFCH